MKKTSPKPKAIDEINDVTLKMGVKRPCRRCGEPRNFRTLNEKGVCQICIHREKVEYAEKQRKVHEQRLHEQQRAGNEDWGSF